MAKLERDIRYIDRDFNTLRNSLIQYSKTYFPNTYNDFTETSTGMLFMEMASYVGDVLSFYLDNQIQETFIQKARQTTNLYALAYSLGYVPKITTAASVEIDFLPCFWRFLSDCSSSSAKQPNESLQSPGTSHRVLWRPFQFASRKSDTLRHSLLLFCLLCCRKSRHRRPRYYSPPRDQPRSHHRSSKVVGNPSSVSELSPEIVTKKLRA